jgi:hypothetical protein
MTNRFFHHALLIEIYENFTVGNITKIKRINDFDYHLRCAEVKEEINSNTVLGLRMFYNKYSI